MANILSCVVISLTRFEFIFTSLFFSPRWFCYSVQSAWFPGWHGAKDIFSSSGDSRLLTALREPISVFPSSSGGWDFHSLLGGSGCHSVWPWMTARGAAIVLPPKPSCTVEMCESCQSPPRNPVVVADEDSSAWRWDPFQRGNCCPRRQVIVLTSSSTKLWQVHTRAAPQKMAGKWTAKSSGCGRSVPVYLLSFNSC